MEAILAAIGHVSPRVDSLWGSFSVSTLLCCRVWNDGIGVADAAACAQKYPGISDRVFLAKVSSKEAKREYLAALLGQYYPHLATVARMEAFVLLCEAEADGKWPHDTLLYSFCLRCKSGELLAACKRVRYYRGLLDVDYAGNPNAFAEQFAIVVEINDVRRAAQLLERRAGDATCWETAFRLCSEGSAVDSAFLVKQVREKESKSNLFFFLAGVLAGSTSSIACISFGKVCFSRECFDGRWSCCSSASSCISCCFFAGSCRCALVVKMEKKESLFCHVQCFFPPQRAKHNPHVLPQAAAAASMRGVDAAQVTRAASFPRDGAATISFDEMPSHWGVRTNGECSVCRSGVSSAMRVFRCGHAAHTECSTEEACSVCFVAQLKTLLK